MSFEIWRWKTVASSLNLSLNHSLGFPGGATGKESACQCRRCKRFGFDPWVGKIPWNRKWQTHSSILAWSIPWAEKPGRVQSMGSQRVSHDWAWVCVRVRAHTHTHTHTLTLCCFVELPSGETHMGKELMSLANDQWGSETCLGQHKWVWKQILT